MDKLYIVIPAYNEEANIQKTIQQWYPIIEKTQRRRSLKNGCCQRRKH